ncbi:hypothetical protein C943_02766 [Mariniradius saccharolyticus AK6]|uniref:Uncharacterized protein n=1 Tax=Mariniradius saccharolyticus AK6 TaxID=1239962 RepID=M7X8D7_9BACT|nr:hypothetical protein C943_02766 [Mariniradius saccharolyticus AK6]
MYMAIMGFSIKWMLSQIDTKGIFGDFRHIILPFFIFVLRKIDA